MVTFAELVDARPGGWLAAGAGLRALAGRLTERADEVAGLARRLGEVWSGLAGTAAVAELSRRRDAITYLAPPAIAADQALAEYAQRLGAARDGLIGVVADLAAAGVRVNPDGSLAGSDPERLSQAATRIGGLLALAAEADASAAARLRGLLPAFDPGTLPAPPPAGVPAIGADPAVVRRWWLELTEAQRRWLVSHHADLIGALDGVPAAIRDQANRLRLAGLPGLDELRRRLANDRSPRAYLLALDATGSRAVVAVGDPDLAEHVLTVVPGTSESVDRIGRLLTRADRLAHAARPPALADPDETTSVVVWLDYAAPADVVAASWRTAAEAAGPALARYAEGVRATSIQHTPHHTVLGHSYGSLVVGRTAHSEGLAADDLIFVGSPGVGVQRAADLGVPPAHVWSSTADADPIRAVDAGAALREPLVLRLNRQPDSTWFGADPSGDGFGARVFSAEPGDPGDPLGAHSAYFETGNRALENIARIARGDGASVR